MNDHLKGRVFDPNEDYEPPKPVKGCDHPGCQAAAVVVRTSGRGYCDTHVFKSKSQETRADPARIAEIMAKAKAAPAPAPSHPLDWARRLRARELAGDRLTITLRADWRRALEREQTMRADPVPLSQAVGISKGDSLDERKELTRQAVERYQQRQPKP